MNSPVGWQDVPIAATTYAKVRPRVEESVRTALVRIRARGVPCDVRAEERDQALVVTLPLSAATALEARVLQGRTPHEARLEWKERANAMGTAPAYEDRDAHSRRIEAERTAREEAHARAVEQHRRLLAQHAEALRLHAAEEASARSDFEASAATRKAVRVGRATLLRALGIGVMVSGLAGTVLVFANWDMAAYWDEVLHTWMVLLIVKLFALLLPIVVAVAPVALGVFAGGALVGAAGDMTEAEFRFRPPPRVPRPPSRPVDPPTDPTAVLDGPETVRAFALRTLEEAIREAVAPKLRASRRGRPS